MKKFLPTSGILGFTLIELLVVITIIAILAVIGFAVFGGLISRGNDSRRAADIKAIADALEVKRANNFYQPITAADFGTGKLPKEPTSRVQKYCYKDGTAAISNPSVWAGACPDVTWTDLGTASGITPSPAAIYFKVCTVNEAGTTGAAGADVICYGSRQ